MIRLVGWMFLNAEAVGLSLGLWRTTRTFWLLTCGKVNQLAYELNNRIGELKGDMIFAEVMLSLTAIPP
ncbi:MAG: hypothetical protein AOA65_0909 [Candidatus Bathyarchaeota archaeon BA1]|nr:MAG: hypothetical protein AOA65_0909 [Candidatus Bathyarchaeota archaeon BA1]